MNPPALRKVPFFSVIIPWHGNKEFLFRATKSLALQTETDFEIIIVCNGKAAGLVSQLQDWNELPKCRVVSCPPADANLARNAGIDTAKGQWLALLDADDEFTPDKLSVMRRAIEASKADCYLSRGKRMRSTGNPIVFPASQFQSNENIAEYFFSRGCNCSTTSIVVRKEIAQRIRFTPGLPKFQDNDFLIRAQAGGANIKMLEDALFIWHDATEEGRISRRNDYNQQMAWAKSLAPAFTDKAFHAFCVRRIAQYVFPRDAAVNLRRFWNGWRLGGISFSETILLIVRALLPKWLAQHGVSLYAWLKQPAVQKSKS